MKRELLILIKRFATWLYYKYVYLPEERKMLNEIAEAIEESGGQVIWYTPREGARYKERVKAAEYEKPFNTLH